MQGADLSDGPFTECWFSRSDLRATTLRGTQFWAAHCEQARFAAADLANADFTGANLTGVVFDKTSLRDAVLVDANLAGATGTIIGPVIVAPGLSLAGEDLQHWLTQRGAQVTLFRAPEM